MDVVMTGLGFGKRITTTTK